MNIINMKRKEQIEQKTNEYVKGSDNLRGYKPDIEDIKIAYQSGAEWADQTMIEKAWNFILTYDPNDYLEEIADFGVYKLNEEKLKTTFYKAMEE